MNFDNLAVSENYMHSKAHKAVKYSKEAEYMGNNFKAVFHEKNQKERQEQRYKNKYHSSMDEFEREQRYYEDKKKALRDVFAEIDVNNDGKISPDELKRFLTSTGMNDDQAIQVTDEILTKLDSDGDGTVSIYEFSD